MKLSELIKANTGFAKLTVTISVDGVQLYPGALSLRELHIDASVEMKCNTASVILCDVTDAAKVRKILQSGACLRITGGYQKKEELVFMGYVHTMTLRESGSGMMEELELYAQDVKGLMMLHKRSAVEGEKGKNALIQEILKTSLYADYITSCAITPLKKTVDVRWSAMGTNDFDILENLCAQTLYTCYVRKDVLRFEPRYTAGSDTMELDAAQEVYEVNLIYTIQDLIGSVQIMACDGYKDKKSVKESVSLSSLPYAKKLTTIMKHTSTSVTDDGFHDIEELKYLAAGIKKEVENSYAQVNGQCVFLPWLLCAMDVVLPKTGDGEKKKGFVTRVVHHIDGANAYTEWEAVIEKG